MSFQVQLSRERLDKVLGVLKHAFEKRSTLPIHTHLSVEIVDQEMTLKATDGDLAFEAIIPIEGSGSKSVAVPGKKFFETVRIYPEGILTLEWPENGNRMWLRAKGFSSEHNVRSVEDFPALAVPDKSRPMVCLPSALFKKAIQLGSIAVSRDATKPALSGVLLHLTAKFIRIVSTDGFRMAVVELPCETGLEADAKIIVNKRVMDIIAGSFGEDSQIELCWDDRRLFLSQPNLKFSSGRITQNYPAYEKVLPAELPRHVSIDREEFVKTLKVVGLKKDDYNKNVRLFFEFPNLRVLFQHPDEGVNQGNLHFSGEEQPLELAFHIDFLTELLDKLPGDEVEYQFKDDVGQGVFMSPSLQDMSFKYILMPVKYASQSD